MIGNNTSSKITKARDISDAQLAGELKQKYRETQTNMRILQYSWLITMSFIAGDQYKYIDKSNYRIKEWAHINGYEEREVYNKMRNMKNTYKARITQKKPLPIATPITMQEKDKRIAQITTAVLDDQYEKQEIDDKIDEIGELLTYFGSAFIKVGWDKELGEELYKDVEMFYDEFNKLNILSDEYKNEINQSRIITKSIHEGDATSSILTPFEFQVDSVSRKNMKEVQWCMHTRIYHNDVLKRTYGLEDKDLSKDEAVNAVTLQEGGISSGVGYVYTANGYRSQELKDHSLLIEYYERPSLEYEEGRTIFTVGNKIVYYLEKLPYKIGADGKRELPFIRIVANEELGNFYGSTPMQDIKAIQRRFNALENRKIEAINRIGVGQWVIEAGSISKSTQLNNKPGQKIIYKPGRREPKKLIDAPRLEEFRNEGINLDKQFSSIAGFTPYDVNQISSAIRSATQMSMLFEQEDLRMGTPIVNIAKGIKLWAKYTVRLLQEFTVGKRFVKYQSGYDDFLEWDKELINDNINIKNINALVKSPAQQTQMMTDLVTMGLMDEQNRFGYDNSMMLLESYGMGMYKSSLSIPGRKDIEKAKRENARATRGMMIIVDKDVDNHSLHLKAHQDYLKSEEYENIIMQLAQVNGLEFVNAIDKALHEHIKEHNSILQIRAMNMAMQQQMQQARK